MLALLTALRELNWRKQKTFKHTTKEYFSQKFKH